MTITKISNNEIIGIDTVGTLVQSNFDNKYIVTVIDHFSGWPEAFPTIEKSETTAGFWKILYLVRHVHVSSYLTKELNFATIPLMASLEN